MSEFHGTKCDNCGKERREEVQDLDKQPNVMTASPIERVAWMQVWWKRSMHFCPECAPFVAYAIGFVKTMTGHAAL